MSILQRLQSNNHILRLGLNYVCLTDRVKDSIKGLLRNCTTLNFLSLEGNCITASCAKEFVNILKENEAIKELVLAANPLKNDFM